MRAEGYAKDELLISQLREYPSTALVILDLLVGARPTFLGDPLPIVIKTSFSNEVGA